MFKERTKKAFAGLLTLCMLIAMLPVFPAQIAQAVKTDAGNLEYYLSLPVVNETNRDGQDKTYITNENYSSYAYITKVVGTSVTTLSDYALENMTYAKTLNNNKKRSPWKVSSVYVSSVTDTSTSGDIYNASPTWVRQYHNYGTGLFVYGNLKNRRASVGYTLKVDANEGGWYNIVPAYYFPKRETDNATLTCTIYNGTAADGNVIGRPFTTNTTTSSWTNGDCGVAYFEPGEYEIVYELKTTGEASSGTNKNNLAFARSVKLLKVDGPSYTITPISADSNISDYALDIGESGSATFALMDGINTLEGVTFSAVSKNTSVADVTVSGNKITVTGKSAGIANIEISAVYQGITTKSTISIQVATASRQAFTYNFTGMYNSSWEKDNTLSNVDGVLLKDGKNGSVMDMLTYDYTSAKGSTPWKVTRAWVGTSNGTFINNAGVYLTNDYGMILNAYNNASYDNEVGIVLKAKDNAAGWYNVTVNAAAFSQATKDQASSVKATFTLYEGTTANDTKKIAEFNPTIKMGSSTISFSNQNMGNAIVSGGEYYLTLRLDVITSNSKTNRVFVKSVTFTPSEAPKDYSVAIMGADASLRDYSLRTGESGTATFQLRNGGFPVEDATFTATSADPSIVSVSASGDKVTVTGHKEGTTKITVNAVDGDTILASSQVEITVVAMQYNFTFLNSAPTDTEIKTLTDYSMTASSGLDPWCFGFQNNATISFRVSSPQGYGAVLAQQTGVAAGIKVKVEEPGIYTPEVLFSGGTMQGVMRVYIAPVIADAVAEDYLVDEYSVGHKDCYLPKSGKSSATFRPVYLEKGEYVIGWEIVGGNPNLTLQPRLFLTSVNLIQKNAFPTFTVTHDEIGDIKLGNDKTIALTAVTADGTIEDFIGADLRIGTTANSIATVEILDNDNYGKSLKITAYKIGQENIPVDVYIKGEKRGSFVLPINVIAPAALTDVSVNLRETKHNTLVLRDLLDVKGHLDVVMTDADDQQVSQLSAELQNAKFNFTSSDTSVATIDGNGVITPITPGKTVVRCDVTLSGVTLGDEIEITVTDGKDRSSYFTDERVAAVRSNIEKYDWAKSSAKAVIKEADIYVDNIYDLYDRITTQELPRSYNAGYKIDPTGQYCNYPDCGVNLVAAYGNYYPWLYDIVNMPWKIQCPSCRRKFPSNDFGSFYKLGMVEVSDNGAYEAKPGHWSYEKSHKEHYYLFADQYAAAGIASYEDYDAKRKAGERMPAVGYLKNALYPELGDTWGVDDGYGYVTGNTFTTGTYTLPEVDTYIACYNHWAVWYDQAANTIGRAVDKLRDAYVYTGDIKYGRAGAMLLDRVADIYPDLNLFPYVWYMSTTEKMVHGKGIDKIWDTHVSRDWAKSYDAFFPAYEDKELINFLSEKAARYGLENPKTSAELLREHCETNILREIYSAAQDAFLRGNFGMHQSAVAAAAVALDSVPETIDMLDWVFQNGEGVSVNANTYDNDYATGGDVMRSIIDKVSRDGTNDEIAPNYVRLWYAYLNIMLDILAGYDKYPQADLFNNPRYVKMLSSMMPLTLSRTATAQISDSGAVADHTFHIESTTATAAFQYTKKPIFAQILYFLNGNSTEGLHYDMFATDPERLADEVQEVIDTYGEYPFDESNLLAGYGFSALRGGTKVEAKYGTIDTQRTFWMSFTKGYVNQKNTYSGHNHYDGLNLGIEAYGLNVAPELGYPENTGTDLYRNWGKATVAHNTVVVDAKHQLNTEASDPLHFDDSGMVKVIDVDASGRYAATDKYRRTIVSVDIDDEIAYGVDFFRVKGGNEHVYSFHALSSLMPEFGKLNGDKIVAVPQTAENSTEYIGSYAGASVPYKTANSESGFAWLYNVDRATDVGKEFFVDFEIQDIRKTLKTDRDLRLRLSMLNSFDMSELAFADGEPADAKDNPDTIKFMLAKRSGSKLDSMFTSVIETYDGESKIASIEKASITDKNGNAVVSEGAKALKVTLTNGRTDFIIYSEDNSKEYIVDGRIAFSGFLGVYSEKDGKNVYSYINDGTKLDTLTATASISGTVESFTTELVDQNYIYVTFDGDIDCEDLVGEHIYAEKARRGNGVYKILGAKVYDEENKIIELDIGDISLIDSIETAYAGKYTYYYNLEPKTRFRIPFAAKMDNRPIATSVEDGVATVGKKFTQQVSAYSPIGSELTYEVISLPRGASFDEDTQTISWTPDSAQLGTSLFALRVTDGTFSAPIYFSATAVKSSSGSGSLSGGSANVKPSAPSSGSTDGGSTTPSTPATPSTPNESDKPAKDDAEDTTDTPVVPDAPAERFVDLGNHSWAKDAISNLVDKGVVNGTSANTFSPANNIKRADFAIMLVRAFGITEGEGENFADVDSNKYYAEELRLAKAAGIVNGIGNDKFNPEGEITRQDMMLMLSRALDAMEVELSEADLSVMTNFADAAQISEYAADAVSRMIKDGIITGSNGKINPLAKATRAEIAVMLDRVLAE